MAISRSLARTLPVSVLLLMPIAANFFKMSFAAYSLPIVDFGRFSLYIGLSSALVYIFNSGLYEGHLKFFSMLKLSRRPHRLSWLQVKAELVSYIFLILSLIVVIFILLAFEVSEAIFILAMVVASHVQAHSNLVTAHSRVENNLLRVGVMLSLRSIASALIFISLLSLSGFSVEISYLYENLAIAVFFGVYLLIRIKYRLNIRLLSTFSVLKHGIWQCYASSIRYVLFAIERFVASILLSPSVMGEYGRLMLVYQVTIVGGGIVSQLIQQKIIYKSLSNGVRLTGIRLLKYQFLIVFVCILMLFAIFALAPTLISGVVYEVLGPHITLLGVALIILSGLIFGTSFIDSLALGSSKGSKLILLQIFCGIIWGLAFVGVFIYSGSWILNLQALMFFLLVGLLMTGNVRFVLLH